MLGGLARWLRAAGYDALFEYGIDDADLVTRCRSEGRILLSCDGPMFDRNVIKSGQVKALRVPRGLGNVEALRFVLEKLHLALAGPRCMGCGGELAEVPSTASPARPRRWRSATAKPSGAAAAAASSCGAAHTGKGSPGGWPN